MSTKDPNAQRMEKIVSLCKRRGFIFQSSEIYGGLNGFWDYGPMGVELKRNLKDFWWRRNVHERDDMVGMDAAIIMNRAVWKASGHEETFSDPMVDCKNCKARLRADQLPEKDGAKYCPNCGSRDLTEPRAFNLMLKSYAGPIESDDNLVYLRPETAQAMFVQFKNILETSRKKLPFGIAQIGKAFRNEINPRNYTFRSREFEQMEIEYFCRAEDGLRLTDYWLEERLKFYEDIGIPRAKIKIHDIPDGERAFYSKKTYDLGTSSLRTERAPRASPTAPTTTSESTSSTAASRSNTSMTRRRKSSCPTWSNPAPAWTAPPSPSSARPSRRRK